MKVDVRNLRWKIRCFSFSVFCTLALAGSVFGSGLMDIYQLAVDNDPILQSAIFEKLSIKEGRKQAIARMLPTIAGSAELTETTQDIKSSDNSVFGVGETDFSTTSYSLTLTQPVFHWDLIEGYQQAKIQNLQAEAEYALAQQELIVRVADLYLQALSAKDQLVFANAEETAVNKQFELASSRFEMDLVPITDLHEAKARLATVQARTIDAKNLLDDALQGLAEVTGKTVDNLNPLKAKIALISPDPGHIDHWIDSALEQNLAIEMQHQAIKIAEKEVSRQRSGHYPNLDLIGRYNNKDTDGTLFGGGSEVETTDILLQLNVPLFQGGYVNSRVREARHQLSAAKQEYVKQTRAVERLTRSAYLGVNSALKRVDALEESVTYNELALVSKQKGFLSGLYTSLAVLDAERDLYLVKQDFAQARYDYILNSLRLKQAVGSLSDDDLKQLNEWFK